MKHNDPWEMGHLYNVKGFFRLVFIYYVCHFVCKLTIRRIIINDTSIMPTQYFSYNNVAVNKKNKNLIYN